MPDALPATQLAIAVDGLGKLRRLTNRLRLIGGKAFAQGLEGMFEVALSSDGVDDGYHVRIINRRAQRHLRSFVTDRNDRAHIPEQPRSRILL